MSRVEEQANSDPISVLLPGPRFISPDRKFQAYTAELNLEVFIVLQGLEAKNMGHISMNIFLY